MSWRAVTMVVLGALTFMGLVASVNLDLHVTSLGGSSNLLPSTAKLLGLAWVAAPIALWVVPWAARKLDQKLSPILEGRGWSRPAALRSAGADRPIEFLPPAKLPSSPSLIQADHAGRATELYRRWGRPEEQIARRDEGRRQALLMASKDLDRKSGERDLRSPLMRLQAYTRYGELNEELQVFIRTTTAWLERKHHFDQATRNEGMHILNVLSDHCERMADDQALLSSEDATSKLTASLKARRSQLQSSVDQVARENQARLTANLEVLSEQVGAMQRQLG
jgi:hypothetical protein